MCKNLYGIVEVACESESATQLVINQLESISTNPSIACSNSGANCLQLDFNISSLPNTIVEQTHLLSPIHVKRKGRPRGSRLQSTVEKVCKKNIMLSRIKRCEIALELVTMKLVIQHPQGLVYSTLKWIP